MTGAKPTMVGTPVADSLRMASRRRVGVAARVAAELGADWVKIPYVAGFEQVVAGCYVPIVVLGGPQRAAADDTLTMLQAALQAGAVGATIGRNIWKAPDPMAMTRAPSRARWRTASPLSTMAARRSSSPSRLEREQ